MSRGEGGGASSSSGSTGPACAPSEAACAGKCVDIDSDAKNCGACGKLCVPAMNVVPACIAGACALGGCVGGFGDCDADSVNGCESNFDDDPKNCGGCGNVCGPGRMCDGGVCLPCPVKLLPRVDSTVGARPYAVALGDLNGDGFLDVVLTRLGSQVEPASFVSVLLNMGDGSLAAPLDYPQGTNQPVGLALADFNGDGRLDLATANNSGKTVGVFIGKGDGSFGAMVAYAMPDMTEDLAVRDFNGDGKLDIVAIASSHINVLVGQGNGNFVAGYHFANNKPYARAFVTADFNGDGKLDLLTGCLCGLGEVNVFDGKGDGTFSYRASYVVDSLLRGLAAADFNGDGAPDLVTSNWYAQYVSVFVNHQHGTFSSASNFLVSDLPFGLATGDIDGDGKVDLVAASGNYDYLPGSINVLANTGGGKLASAVSFPTPGGGTHAALGDLDGDGKLDVVVPSHLGTTLGVFFNGTCSK